VWNRLEGGFRLDFLPNQHPFPYHWINPTPNGSFWRVLLAFITIGNTNIPYKQNNALNRLISALAIF
jgi:hypothetical protein